MGSFNFKWTHPADEVYVTGTFDNWSKSTLLNKLGTIHEKSLAFPKIDEKIYYKFVADGKWQIDPTHKIEKDHEGNENNVLFPDDIEHHGSSIGLLSSVGPGASTLAMAGAQAKSGTPGAFPEDAAEDNKQFSVNPIPATSGAGNPVQLAPGEKVPDPSTLTGNTVQSTATTDKASYENSSAAAPEQLTGAFGRPPSSSHVIPESSLPMGQKSDLDDGTTISSVGPSSTTAGLAGQQPIEPRGEPTVIKDSSDEGKAEDKSASSGGIYAKAAAGVGAAGVTAAGAAVAANQFVKDKTGTDPKANLPTSVQDTVDKNAAESSIPQQAGVSAPKASESVPERETADNVPSEVTESQKEANVDPEASANPEAVHEKSEAEKELLSKVKESDAQGEHAPTDSAAKSAAAPAAASAAAEPAASQSVFYAEKPAASSSAAAASEPAASSSAAPAIESAAAASAVPAVAATTSSSGAPQIGDPTAGVEPIKLDDKPPESGLNAPASSAAVTDATKTDAQKLAAVESPPSADHRDVSPISKPAGGQSAPLVTSGVASSSIPDKNGPETPTNKKRLSIADRFKGSEASDKDKSPASPSDSKKEKRRSFFGRIKDKLKDI